MCVASVVDSQYVAIGSYFENKHTGTYVHSIHAHVTIARARANTITLESTLAV